MKASEYSYRLFLMHTPLGFTFLKALVVLLAVLALFTGSHAGQHERLEAAFSPGGGAQGLVIRVIESARQEINVMAYSFTSAPVAEALAKAMKRGVRVQVVADSEANTSGGGAAKARAAMSMLVTAGASVKLVDAFAIHHDKVLIVDRRHVQTGSFNFSASADRKNSENVLVVWDSPELARIYLGHFTRNSELGRPFTARY